MERRPPVQAYEIVDRSLFARMVEDPAKRDVGAAEEDFFGHIEEGGESDHLPIGKGRGTGQARLNLLPAGLLWKPERVGDLLVGDAEVPFECA